jgi:tripeptide aminopeptidase
MVDRNRLVSTFLDLVRLDSPGWHEEAVARYASDRLRELGLEVKFDPTGNVIAYLRGAGLPLLLNCHMDSVDPCLGIKPVVEGEIIRSDGTTVLGADDRAGVAALLEGLQSAVEGGSAHRSIEVVLTRAEEGGLHGVKGLDFSLIRAKVGVTLDASGRIGSLVVAAPSQNSLEVVIHGRAAHAGVAPEEGISAIAVAAEAITNMPLGRIDHETTANVGVMRAGTARNIVPETAELQVEARSHDEAKLQAQTDTMIQAFRKAAEEAGASVDITITREYTGFRLSPSSEAVQIAQRALEAVRVEPTLAAHGGGSDANVFNARGMEVANISVGYIGAHTLTETLYIPDLVKAAEAVAAMVEGR